MGRDSKLRKKLIRFLAKVYIFFKVANSKPKYKRFFIGLAVVIVLAIALIIGLAIHNSNSNQKSGKNSDVSQYTTEDSDSQVEWYGMLNVDFDSLYATNEDVIGWIFFENDDISYPILYATDDDYYLHRNLLKENQTAGSIFMEAQNSKDFTDRHTLIYGHNMKNTTMFGKLKYYKNDGYYEDHQYFQIIMKNRDTGTLTKYRYHIFAYKDVSVDDEIYYVLDNTYDQLPSFAVNNIKNNSLLQSDYVEEITTDDYIITLSTCSSTADRFVVSAVRCATCTVEE